MIFQIGKKYKNIFKLYDIEILGRKDVREALKEVDLEKIKMLTKEDTIYSLFHLLAKKNIVVKKMFIDKENNGKN